MIKTALKESFGIDCLIEETNIKGLPVYMKSGRKMYTLRYEDDTFLLVELSISDRFGTIALKKQAIQYSEKSGLNVIYAFKSVSKVQRDALVSNRISFVCLPDQFYLPVMGIALRNHFKRVKEICVDKMMPATQSLFLYLLYGKKEAVKKSEAAKDLRLTKTSITRASEQLKAMGLITEESEGKTVYMRPVSTGRDYYESAKPYLINPVQKTIYVAGVKDMDDLYEAGESALSRNSMLAEPGVRCFAVYKGNSAVKDFDIIDPQWTSNSMYYRIELWKYNPAFFTTKNGVDVVSLSKSLANGADERVLGELEEYLENYEW
ncbi:MAG: MarR family transcriptional regulator [Lachnospiraceae bacterium]|nr:MarR family transcriptional regulator [Lachnospiraceae bacterium]